MIVEIRKSLTDQKKLLNRPTSCPPPLHYNIPPKIRSDNECKYETLLLCQRHLWKKCKLIYDHSNQITCFHSVDLRKAATRDMAKKKFSDLGISCGVGNRIGIPSHFNFFDRWGGGRAVRGNNQPTVAS